MKINDVIPNCTVIQIDLHVAIMIILRVSVKSVKRKRLTYIRSAYMYIVHVCQSSTWYSSKVQTGDYIHRMHVCSLNVIARLDG